MASSYSKGGGVDTQSLSSGVVTHMAGENAPSPVREEELRNRFLSFEPIFDNKGQVVARELVLRGQAKSTHLSLELQRMNEDMLLTGLYSLGQDNLITDQPLFVRISREVLFSEALAELSQPGVVWVLREFDDEIAQHFKQLSETYGMRFCFDTTAPDTTHNCWNFQRFSTNAQVATMPEGQIIVRKISREQELSLWPATAWFMGEYFTGVRTETSAKPSHELRLELASVAMRQSLPSLIQFLRLNASMENQFMHIARSMAGGLTTEADSAAHAMIKMGGQRSQRVAILTALAGTPVTADNRLYTQVALSRALFMGKLAVTINNIALPEEAFETGLFSTFPAAFSMTVSQLYRRIGLPRMVYESLAGQDTPIKKLLHLAHACEHQKNDLMGNLAGTLGLSMESIAAAHLEAAITAEDIGSRLL